MLRVYARTREREKAWKFGAACLVASAASSPLLMLIFRHKKGDGFVWSFQEVRTSYRVRIDGFANKSSQFAWIFSIVLESLCILPQLLLLRQTTVPTVINSYYLLTLGSYRGFYILNWIWRDLDITDHGVDPISVIFGVIQTAFYVDFAWVYYSRQRVKLRNGGLVDADDMRSGWLLRTVFGNKRIVGSIDDEDEESAPALGRHADRESVRPTPGRNGSSKWGARGISVSADDGVLESERNRQRGFADQEEGIIDSGLDDDNDADAKMKDPDELAKILNDDDDDGSDDGVLKSAGPSDVGNGSEWRDGGARK